MHTVSPLPLLHSLLLYALLCFFSISFGMALLSWLRPSLPWNIRLAISPLISLSVWSIALTTAQTAGATIQSAASPLWLATLLCCGFGAASWYQTATSWRELFVPLAAPILLLFPAFWNGITNYQLTTAPDGWNYVAVGQYLWGHSKLALNGNLVPLYQHARISAYDRTVGSSLLGFLSFLFGPGDSQLTFNLLIVLAIFSLAAATWALAWSWRFSSPWRILLVALVALGGWTANVILAGNLDQLLSIPYLIAGIALCLTLENAGAKEAFILGLFAAAVVTTYVELAPIILIEIAVVLVYVAVAKRLPIREHLRFYSLTLLSTAVLLSPAWQSLREFFFRQLHVGLHSPPRPGEYVFYELVVPWKYFVTFWGFGAEWLGNPVTRIEAAGAVLLAVLVTYGIWVVLKAKRMDFVVLISVYSAAMSYFAFGAKYGYGAYKIMSYTWWLICVCLVFGLRNISGRLTGWRRWVLLGVGLLPCIRLLGPMRSVALQPTIPASRVASLSMDSFRGLETVPDLTGGQPIYILVDDWLANLWAVYYTRNMPVRLGSYRMYMAAQPRVMDVSRQPALDEDLRLLLIDDLPGRALADPAHWTLLKALPSYRLLRAKFHHWALITDIRNRNSLESLNGRPFMWLGDGSTEVDLLANVDGQVHVMGTARLGPSVAGKSTRDVQVETDGPYRTSANISEGPFSISFPVHKGKTVLRLTASDPVTVGRLPNGDTRPLVLGVEGLIADAANTGEERVLPQEVHNPYQAEITEQGMFYWMGVDSTEIRFYCDRPGKAELQAHCSPGPSISGTTKRKIRLSAGAYVQEVVVDKPDCSVAFPVHAGLNSVRLLALDKPNVPQLPNGDQRKLIMGLTQVQVVQVETSGTIAVCSR